MQSERGDAGLLAQTQLNIASNQAVMAAPARQSQPQMRRTDAGARQHAVAAPGQAALKPAQRLIVQLAHGGVRQSLHLQGRDALCGICHQGWRYLCLFKGGKRRHLPGFIRPDDSLHKHHGGNCRVRFQHQAGIVWQRCLDQRRGEHLAIIATFLTSSGQG